MKRDEANVGIRATRPVLMLGVPILLLEEGPSPQIFGQGVSTCSPSSPQPCRAGAEHPQLITPIPAGAHTQRESWLQDQADLQAAGISSCLGEGGWRSPQDRQEREPDFFFLQEQISGAAATHRAPKSWITQPGENFSPPSLWGSRGEVCCLQRPRCWILGARAAQRMLGASIQRRAAAGVLLPPLLWQPRCTGISSSLPTCCRPTGGLPPPPRPQIFGGPKRRSLTPWGTGGWLSPPLFFLMLHLQAPHHPNRPTGMGDGVGRCNFYQGFFL